MVHIKTPARQLAIQYLYMHDILEGKEVQPLSDFLGAQAEPPNPSTIPFIRELVEHVLRNTSELDKEIAEAATNWKLSRMATVDRNILRLGLAEMIACPETSHKVILDEAVELARRFSSLEACAFVNGILDKIKGHRRPQES